MHYERYIAVVMVIAILVLGYPYIYDALAAPEFTASFMGSAVKVIVELLWILSIIVMCIVLIYMAVKDATGG